MRVLAEKWGQDNQLWEMVGVLHDIDWDETREAKENHGIEAATRLEGKLPADALHAIMSHDYRTGIEPESVLDDALIFSDALAHIFNGMKDASGFSYPLFERTLMMVTQSGRPWLLEIIQRYIVKNNLTPNLIEDLWHASIKPKACI
jgi:hypothetical protein